MRPLVQFRQLGQQEFFGTAPGPARQPFECGNQPGKIACFRIVQLRIGEIDKKANIVWNGNRCFHFLPCFPGMRQQERAPTIEAGSRMRLKRFARDQPDNDPDTRQASNGIGTSDRSKRYFEFVECRLFHISSNKVNR
jgi:hypothetical protein